MSPEEVEKIKVGIREDYLDIMDPEEEEEATDFLLSLAKLTSVETFAELIAWLKVEDQDLEHTLGYVLFGLSPSSDYEDLKLILTIEGA